MMILCLFFSCSQQEKNSVSPQAVSINDVTEDKAATKNTAKEVEKPATPVCNYDNDVSDLGLGLVQAPTTFELFNDSLLTNLFLQWDMHSSDTPPKPLCSKYYMPEYGIMHFICLQKTSTYFKVLVNFNEVKYFPATTEYQFQTWENYILSSYGIRRTTSEDGSIAYHQSLRSSPSESAKSIEIPEGLENFCPREIKGDWVKVTYDCFYNVEEPMNEGEPCHNYINKCKNPTSGWLRWRQKNKILIDIFLMP